MPTLASILEKRRFSSPLLYGISSLGAFPDTPPDRYLELLFQTPAHILQWREKDLSPLENRRLVRRGVELSKATDKIFIVNSFVEMALEEEADGAHLTSVQDLAAARNLRVFHGCESFLLGKSTHSALEVKVAEQQGADYVLIGPVCAPLSKESPFTLLGFSGLRELSRTFQVPLFALGGIDHSLFDKISETGAAGIAGITWLSREVEKLLRHQGCS